MSLQAFQQAIVDLTLAPQKVRALRQGDTCGLAAYGLTERERDRILDLVHQPGIFVACSLSRGSRLEVIFAAFPMTCVLLQPMLRELLDELWQEHRPTNYQLAGEEAAFAAFVKDGIAAGRLAVEYLEDIFGYETTCLNLQRGAHQAVDPDSAVEAVVEFRHSPDALLPPLSRLDAPPAGLPTGRYLARVILQDGKFQVETLHATA